MGNDDPLLNLPPCPPAVCECGAADKADWWHEGYACSLCFDPMRAALQLGAMRMALKTCLDYEADKHVPNSSRVGMWDALSLPGPSAGKPWNTEVLELRHWKEVSLKAATRWQSFQLTPSLLMGSDPDAMWVKLEAFKELEGSLSLAYGAVEALKMEVKVREESAKKCWEDRRTLAGAIARALTKAKETEGGTSQVVDTGGVLDDLFDELEEALRRHAR